MVVSGIFIVLNISLKVARSHKFKLKDSLQIA
jgi:hypothetical protein